MGNTTKRNPTVKFTASLRPDVFEWVVQKSNELGMNRSAFLALCVTNYRTALETQPKLNRLLEDVSKLMEDYDAGKLTRSEAVEEVSKIDQQYSKLPKVEVPPSLT